MGKRTGMRMILEIIPYLIPSYEGSNVESNFRYINDNIRRDLN